MNVYRYNECIPVYYSVPGLVTGSYTVPTTFTTRDANILFTLSNRSQSDYKDRHDPTTPYNGGTGADPQVSLQFIQKMSTTFAYKLYLITSMYIIVTLSL